MKYISLFSGIEAATVAWESLGWEPVAFSEIEEFPSAVLSYRFPNVPNLGDVTKVDWRKYYGEVDIVVGGSPCQSFSVAGKREGLKGESGRLMFEYIRAVREIMPRYFVWENVEGAITSENGEAFKQLLSEMDEIGYGLAWRVLDSQFFGVAQRRERVFLVGCLGDPRRAAEILFESQSLCWDFTSSRNKRKELTSSVERDAGIYCIQGNIARGARMGQEGKGWSDSGESYTLNTMDIHAVAYSFIAGTSSTSNSIGYQEERAPTLRSSRGSNQVPAILKHEIYTMKADNDYYENNSELIDKKNISQTTVVDNNYETLQPVMCSMLSNGEDVVGTLCNCDHKGTNNQYVSQGKVVMQWQEEQPSIYRKCSFATYAEGEFGTLRASGGDLGGGSETLCVSEKRMVRKLTPRECERLQGFPDDWTLIPWKDKPIEMCPDTHRYKAIGNSMAVPVMRWIGERINKQCNNN